MNINEYVAIKTQMQSVLAELQADALIPLFEELFEELPVMAVGWRQWTPSWNDGVPCLFGVTNLSIAFHPGVGRCAACDSIMLNDGDIPDLCPTGDGSRCRFTTDWSCDEGDMWTDWLDERFDITDESDDDVEEDDSDGYDVYDSVVGTVANAPLVCNLQHPVVKRFYETFGAIDDVLESLFGSSAEVIVSRDDDGEFVFEVDEYDCGY